MQCAHADDDDVNAMTLCRCLGQICVRVNQDREFVVIAHLLPALLPWVRISTVTEGTRRFDSGFVGLRVKEVTFYLCVTEKKVVATEGTDQNCPCVHQYCF